MPHLFVADQMSEVLSEAVPNQLVVLGDVIDDGAETTETGGDHRLVVEEDQFDGGLLQLGEEDLAGVLYQGHRQLQGPSDVGNDLFKDFITHWIWKILLKIQLTSHSAKVVYLVVPLSLASHIEVRLQRLDVVDQQLGPDLGEQVGGGEAGDDPVRLAAAADIAHVGRHQGLLLSLQHGLHQAVDDLLAGLDQLLGRLKVHLGGVVLVSFGDEQL